MSSSPQAHEPADTNHSTCRHSHRRVPDTESGPPPACPHTDPLFVADCEQEPEVPRGLPRPLFAGWPVPFNTPTESRPGGRVPMFRNHDDRRQGETIDRDLCMVCGESLRGGRVVIVVDLDTGRVVDEAGMHERCGRLSLVWCPWLRDPANRIQVRSLTHRNWRSLRRDNLSFNAEVDFRDQGQPFGSPSAPEAPPARTGCPFHS